MLEREVGFLRFWKDIHCFFKTNHTEKMVLNQIYLLKCMRLSVSREACSAQSRWLVHEISKNPLETISNVENISRKVLYELKLLQ